MHKTAVATAAALFAAGCSAGGGTDDAAPSDPSSPSDAASSEVAEDRPIYLPEITSNEFCPPGPDFEALDSAPENAQLEIYHNAVHSVGDQSDPEPTRELDCDYFYTPGDEAADRLSQDFATPAAELHILEEPIDPASRSVLAPADFPEFPDHFQVTGWDHTATEEETDVCLSDVGLLYEECEDGQTLVKEVFTLTGFDSNLDVTLLVEYRYAGDPAEYGPDQVDEIESRSRQIAADFLPLLLKGVPTEEA